MIKRRIWIMILLGIGMVWAPSLTRAQQSEQLVGAEEILTRANASGAKQDYAGAIDLLTQALQRYPTYQRLYLALADWQEARGMAKFSGAGTAAQVLKSPDDAQDIFETYGRAAMYLPDTREIRRRVNLLTTEAFPIQLGAYGPLALPGNAQLFAYTITDPRLPAESRGVQQGLITTTPLTAGATLQRDPKADRGDAKIGAWSFPHILYAYAYDRGSQCWRLRFRVLWQASGHEADRTQLARLTGQLMIRLSGLAQAYTGFTPRFSDGGAINVWLLEGGDAGAEAYNEQIFVYNVGTPRSETEWIRELAHEYGHQTLPPVGGYTQPEWSANGYLGERLFMRWLTANPEPTSAAHPWVWALNAVEVNEKRMYPLIKEFVETGVENPQLRGTDEAAMNAFIGMALYLEETRGSWYLARVLSDMTSPSFAGANGFLESVEYQEKYVQSLDSPVVRLRLRDLPQDIPYRAYLRSGNWQGELQGLAFQPLKAELAVDGKSLPLDAQGRFTLTGLPAGWHQFRVTPIAGGPALDLTQLKLSLAQ